MPKRPLTAIAPYGQPALAATAAAAGAGPAWKNVLRFAGPGLLVSVGYMDPGNWATSIQAGSRFGYDLLFVVVVSSMAAIVLQCLSMRLGIVTGKDLAQHCRDQYPARTRTALWLGAELSIIACDLAEVLGCALAFKLLLGIPLPAGVALTAFDTILVLVLRGRGWRRLEAIVLALVATIGTCLFAELLFIAPDWQALLAGTVPSLDALSGREPLYLAIGILGATVMPHNLYLHSSVVQARVPRRDPPRLREAVRMSRWATIGSLLVALFINSAILVLAAAAFHRPGGGPALDIDQAFYLLAPVAGTTTAALLFGLALLAAGQSSTFTGTIAGQVIMEGFVRLRIKPWQRRAITRALALAPALAGVLLLGEHAIGDMLVASQVVLSLQLPFALYPLIRFTGQRGIMGEFANRWWTSLLAWTLFVVISAANAWLVVRVLA